MNPGVTRRARFLLVWLVVCGVASVGRAELPEEIRVLTYNIHRGEGVDGKFDLPRIAKVIQAASPDIVAVQEVDQRTRRASGVDQPVELARLTGMEIVFGRNIDYDGGGYGTAVLTRLPVRRYESVKLRSFYEGTPEHPEQRAVQVVELGAKDEPGLVFLCTHLDYRPPDNERMASAATINELADKYRDELMILAGDLNAESDSRVIRELQKKWKVAGANGEAEQLLTFPSDVPVKWIDYIMCRPAERWHVVEVRVLEEPVASDHRPLLAALRRVKE